VTPPIVSKPEGSNPYGYEETIDEEKFVVGDVVGMMRSFQRISKGLIDYLDQVEARAFVPNEGSEHASTGSSNLHRELNKVNFLEY
jgi:hypothetical protein